MFGFFYLIARAGSEVSAMIICVIFDLGMAVIMFLFGICFVKSNGKAAACEPCSGLFIVFTGSVCNMDLSICFIDERTYETRKNRKEHLGKNYMRKKIYKLSRNRIILGNKRNFNYLKEMT